MIEVKISNYIYSGWKNVVFSKSLNELCGSYSMSLVKEKRGKLADLGISEGAKIDIFSNRSLMTAAFVEVIRAGLNSSQVSLDIEGRERTCDLVDCPYMGSKIQFNNIDYLSFLKKIASQHKISVRSNVLENPQIKYGITPGATCWEIMSEVSRKYGFILITDTDGAIVVEKAGRMRNGDSLEDGVNCSVQSVAFDSSERFGEYHVKSQANQDDDFFGEKANNVHGIAKDEYIERYRPFLIDAEHNMTQKEASERAEYEAAWRRAKSVSAKVVVPSWRNKFGVLWLVNHLVPFRSSYFGVDTELIISEISYRIDSGNESVEMTLEPKDAYEKRSVIKKKNKKKEKDFWDSLIEQREGK